MAMRLRFDYLTGDFAVFQSEYEDAIRVEMTADDELVISYDIDHWTTEDFEHFVSLGEGDRVGLLESYEEAHGFIKE